MNDISASLIRIAIFSLPGFAGTQVYRKLVARRTKADWESLYEILIFSIVGYLIPLSRWPALTATILLSIVRHKTQSQIFTTWSSGDSWVIVTAVIVATIAAYIAAAVDRTNVINWLARKIRASNRTSDADVWHWFHQTLKPPEAIIRCPSINRAYHGFIKQYSETGEPREIVLLNVTVYLEAEGTPLYKWDQAYLKLDAMDVIIQVGFRELPSVPDDNGELSHDGKKDESKHDNE